MKFYGDAPYASMEMRFDQLQHDLLVDLIKKEKITVAIETGTYLGLGSTTNVAKAFLQADVDPDTILFYTFEANKENYNAAVKNLAQYPFVTPIHGRNYRRKSSKRIYIKR